MCSSGRVRPARCASCVPSNFDDVGVFNGGPIEVAPRRSCSGQCALAASCLSVGPSSGFVSASGVSGSARGKALAETAEGEVHSAAVSKLGAAARTDSPAGDDRSGRLFPFS